MAFFIKKLNHTPKRILVSRTDRIGDFILTLPVFEAIKTALDVELVVLCQQGVKPLLDNNPFVDDTIVIESNISQDKYISEILSRQFDTLLVLVNDPIIRDLLPALKSIPVRIGPLNKPSLYFRYTHPVIQKRSRSIMNEADYNLELLGQFDIHQIQPIKPRLYLTDNEIQAFQSKHDDLFKGDRQDIPKVIVHAGMGGSALNLILNKYKAIISYLLEKNLRVILTGTGDKEYAINQELMDSQKEERKNSIINVADRFSLRELAIIASLSQLFIGPSTGPTHLANAVDTPLISFYPPIQVQSAIRWQPYHANSVVFTPQVPCGQKYKCIGDKCKYYYCMDTIDDSNIFQAIDNILNV